MFYFKKNAVPTDHSVKQNLEKLLLIQSIFVVLVSIGWLLSSWKAFYSSLVGGSICVIASYYFASKLFSVSGARNARKIVQAMYVGEGVKLILSAVLFAAVFKWSSVAALPLFTGFIAAQLVIWLAPFVLDKK